MRTLRNRVQLFGNLGSMPEVRELENGKKVARLSIAINETFKNSKGEKVKTTQWHQLVAWGSVAEVAEKYMKVGQEIGLEGRLNNRSYEDEKGETKYITEIIVSEFLLLPQRA